MANYRHIFAKIFTIDQGIWLLSLACLLMSGCLTTPLDGSVIDRKDAPVKIGGYYPQDSLPNPNQSFSMPVYAYNRSTKRWDAFETVSTRPADEQVVGTESWHPFQKTVTLPQENRYWGWAGDDKPRIQLKVGGSSESASLAMFTFKESDIPCMSETLNRTGSGYEVMFQCSSKMTASLKVECGGENEACCRNERCVKPDGWPYFAYLTCERGICRERHLPPPSVSGGSSGCDEPEGEACTVHPSTCGGSPGFTVSGTTECSGGRIVCEPDALQFCNNCGGRCGACNSQPCGPGNLCYPGSLCISGECIDATDCAPNAGSAGHCWKPSDVGSCSSDQLPVNYCLYDTVWYEPGDTWTARDGCNTCTCDEGRNDCTRNAC